MSSAVETALTSSHWPQNIGIVIGLAFFIYVLLAAIFFLFLVRYLTGSLTPSILGPTVVSVVALTVASLPAGLIPIDAFVVGYMKNSTGQFQEWASDPQVQQNVASTMVYAYYVCYIASLVNIFLVIPATYLFHKKDEDESLSFAKNCKRGLIALGGIVLYLVMVATVCTVGYVAPARDLPNSTIYTGDKQFDNLIGELETTKLEDMLSYALNLVRIFGMCLISVYLGVGLADGPLNHIQGYRDPKEELDEIINAREDVENEIAAITESENPICPANDAGAEVVIPSSLEIEEEDVEIRAWGSKNGLSSTVHRSEVKITPVHVNGGSNGAECSSHLTVRHEQLEMNDFTEPKEGDRTEVFRRHSSGIELDVPVTQEITQVLPEDGDSSIKTEEARLSELETEEVELRKREDELKEETRHWFVQLVTLSRPFQLAVGLGGIFVGLLIFTSLFMTNILRSIHSLGQKFGYMMPSAYLPNPLDQFLLLIQGAFPLDYVIILILIGAMALSSITGFRRLGIGIPWVKRYEIVPWKTESRSLLILTMNLAIMLFTLDVFLLSFLPQYATFSSQHYVACLDQPLPTPLPDSSSAAQLTTYDECDEAVRLCEWTAKVPKGQCVMTRLSVLWARSSYKTWYFGALVYWFSWIFLAILVLEACWAVFRFSSSLRLPSRNLE